MSNDLFLNLAEVGRQTAVEESNQHAIDVIYRYIQIVVGDNDYCSGIRTGLLCAANILKGDKFPMPIKPVGIDNIETSRSLGDIL